MNWKDRNTLVIAAGEAVSTQPASRWERRVRAREHIACALREKGITATPQTIQHMAREAVTISFLVGLVG